MIFLFALGQGTNMQGKKGASLLLIIMITSLFMLLAAFLVKIAYNSHATTNSLLQREGAFWLAEAGLQMGGVKIRHNPAWYTDLPHHPGNDRRWLQTQALGERQGLGGGSYKVVREKGAEQFYAVGSKGKAVVILKVKFTLSPFKNLSWEEL
jgi:hypothetical protein